MAEKKRDVLLPKRTGSLVSPENSAGTDANRFARPGAQAARRQAESAPVEARNRALNDRIRARLRGRNNGG